MLYNYISYYRKLAQLKFLFQSVQRESAHILLENDPKKTFCDIKIFRYLSTVVTKTIQEINLLLLQDFLKIILSSQEKNYEIEIFRNDSVISGKHFVISRSLYLFLNNPVSSGKHGSFLSRCLEKYFIISLRKVSSSLKILV